MIKNALKEEGKIFTKAAGKMPPFRVAYESR
jgi:hypothetical protein